MLNPDFTAINGQLTMTVRSATQTAAVVPPPVVTTYHWQIYDPSGVGVDVGLPFDTIDNLTAAHVYDACFLSANGTAALATLTSDTVSPQTYDVLSVNHVMFDEASVNYQPTDPLPIDGLLLDPSDNPYISLVFETDTTGTWTAGLRLNGTTVS